MYSEDELLAALATGSRQATEQVYRQNKKPLIAWLMQRGCAEIDAEEVFHEAIVVLFEKAQQEQFTLSCKISTYLFSIGKHLWYKRATRAGKSIVSYMDQEDIRESGDVDYAQDIAVQVEREALYANLEDALESLGSPCNQLIKAFYVEQKSMKEIAEVFGYTNPENAKTQKYKCLNRLKKIFNLVKAH